MSPISSGRVNADWAGPRRAAITTSRTAEPASACSAWSADVGAGQVVRVGGKHPRDVQRDVAVADDHDTFVVEIDWQIGKVGMAVDPRDQLGRGAGARQAHAGDIQPAVIGRTDRVQHGVVVGQQVGMAQVLADLDIEIEPEVAMADNPVE